MKHDVIRSTVHNALDSLTSGCSFAFSIGDYDFGFWEYVWSMPEGVFEADLITGDIPTPAPLAAPNAYRKLSQAIHVVSRELPDFLHKHGCEPDSIASVAVRFETNQTNQQCVSVTIIQTDGKKSEDHYEGTPLRRLRLLDGLGRVRTAR